MGICDLGWCSRGMVLNCGKASGTSGPQANNTNLVKTAWDGLSSSCSSPSMQVLHVRRHQWGGYRPRGSHPRERRGLGEACMWSSGAGSFTSSLARPLPRSAPFVRGTRRHWGSRLHFFGALPTMSPRAQERSLWECADGAMGGYCLWLRLWTSGTTRPPFHCGHAPSPAWSSRVPAGSAQPYPSLSPPWPFPPKIPPLSQYSALFVSLFSRP